MNRDKFSISVSSVVELADCQVKSLLMSSNNPYGGAPNKAAILGTLCHNMADLHYSDNDDIDSLWGRAYEKTVEDFREYEDSASIRMLRSNRDWFEIKSKMRYLKAFVPWAEKEGVPVYTEKKLQVGYVTGRVDRLDLMPNGLGYLVTDYKFSTRSPKGRILERYKLQLAGYAYLTRQNGIDVRKARIVTFLNASHREYVFDGDELEDYVEDFEGLVEMAHEVYQTLLCGGKPEFGGLDCRTCWRKDICKILRG